MRKVAAIAAGQIGLLLAQPCLAADDFREVQGVERRSAAFAGASFRLRLGGDAVSPPTLRLKLATRHVYESQNTAAPTQVREFSAVELGLTKTGKPAPYVAGQSTAEIKRKANLVGNTDPITVALITAMVVTAVFLLSMDWDGEPARDNRSPSS